MKTTEEDLASLHPLCKSPTVREEGGKIYISLLQLHVPKGGGAKVMDALLLLSGDGGYETRLLLAEPISEKASNWTTKTVFGRVWHTWSWKGIPNTLPLVQILLEHMRALQ